jgi:hypothetical protein
MDPNYFKREKRAPKPEPKPEPTFELEQATDDDNADIAPACDDDSLSEDA